MTCSMHSRCWLFRCSSKLDYRWPTQAQKSQLSVEQTSTTFLHIREQSLVDACFLVSTQREAFAKEFDDVEAEVKVREFWLRILKMRLKKTCLKRMLISRKLLTLVLEKLLKRRSKKPTLKLKMLRFLTMAKTCLTMTKTVTYLMMMISNQTNEIGIILTTTYLICSQYRIEALE